ncbi:hypothetical protein PF005_g9189, partial [Phytophthora fragariae]
MNDSQHAHAFGDNCISTLSQTSSLIESTIRAFQSAGSMRLAALGCKMASVVHLTVYRLQHRKLQSFYSELFTPGRSPEPRENGLTPPIDPRNEVAAGGRRSTAPGPPHRGCHGSFSSSYSRGFAGTASMCSFNSSQIFDDREVDVDDVDSNSSRGDYARLSMPVESVKRVVPTEC